MTDTNPEKTKLITNLLRVQQFNFPALVTTDGSELDVLQKLAAFNQNTSRVLRITKLADTKTHTSISYLHDMCKHAITKVLNTLREIPSLRERQIAFTLVDGTEFKDIPKETSPWATDISFVSVFWDSRRNPVIAVMTAMRKFVRGIHFYHLEEPNTQEAFIFTYDDMLTEFGLSLVLGDAITERAKLMHVHDFGVIISRALEDVAKPTVEYPVAAAAYLDDRVFWVPRPFRHHHIVHSQEFKDALLMADDTDIVQGFLTNHGNFVTRFRGMYQAVKAKRIINTPPMPVAACAANAKIRLEIERKMGGIYQPEDLLGDEGDYRIVTTGLFSEDLW